MPLLNQNKFVASVSTVHTSVSLGPTDICKTPTPGGHWAYIANDLLKLRKADLGAAAETFARLNMAMSDAFVAAWYTKYTLNVIRPVTYVQLVIDSNWVPTLLPTPPFPDYPSGHSVQSSSAQAVLGKIFGANTEFVDNTHNDRGWGPRTFKSFKAAADEAARAVEFASLQARATDAEARRVRADAMDHARACMDACGGWTVETLGHNIESAFGDELDADECDDIARRALGL